MTETLTRYEHKLLRREMPLRGARLGAGIFGIATLIGGGIWFHSVGDEATPYALSLGIVTFALFVSLFGKYNAQIQHIGLIHRQRKTNPSIKKVGDANTIPEPISG